MKLKEAVNTFVEYKSCEISELSIKDYKILLANLCKTYREFELNQITDLMLLEWLNAKQLSWLGFNNYRKRLNVFFTFWHKRRVISENPIYFIVPKKPNRKLGEKRPEEVPKNLSIELRREIITRFKLYSSAKYHSFVCLLAATGARPSEARKLLKTNLQLEEAYLEQTKTYQPRTLFFPKVVGQIILDYANSHPSRYVFPSKDDINRPMGYEGFKKEWDMLRYGLVQPETNILINPYMLRHSFATDMLGNVDILEASKFIGNSPEVFKGYVHANKQRLQKTYNKIKNQNVFTCL